MDVISLLRDTRAAHPRCDSLVFGDLSTGTVLSAASADGAGLQELHDALLGEMALLLDMVEEDEGRNRAIVLVPGEMRIGVRLADNEAIAARWRPDAPGEAVAALDALADRLDPPA